MAGKVRIANLNIKMSASTAGLAGPMRKVKGEVKGVRTGLDKTSLSLKRMALQFAGFIGVALGVRAAINSVRTSLDRLDKIGKVSTKIGVGVEALQKMRFAGQLTGVEITTMDMALQRFTRRTAEAAVGTGEAKAAFKELGIDAKRFIRLPLERRMIELADAFAKVENKQTRLRLAFKLFDSEGAALVSTLGGGSDALQDMFAQAQKAGIFTAEDIAKAEAANDAILRISKTLEFIAGKIAIELSPAIDKLTNSLQKLGFTGEGTGKVIGAAIDTQLERITQGRILILTAQLTFARMSKNKSLIEETTAALREQRKILEEIRNPPPTKPRRTPADDFADFQADLARAATPKNVPLAFASAGAFSLIQGAARKDHLAEIAVAAKKRNEILAKIDKKLIFVVPAAL